MCQKFLRLRKTGFITSVSVILILILIQNGCKPNNQASGSRANWTASVTESVPLKVREGIFSKENLVQNPSFETGKYYIEDSLSAIANISGWSIVGKNVDWVDLDRPGFFHRDVYSGKHAVKVHRTRANETDPVGEGILSDYIRVIPGNYTLSYMAKLKNINPQAGREGTKLYEAVNIEIRFFDKNKTRINGQQNYPYKNILLNAGFKGYSFSNFWHIDSLGWGKIYARTYNYPLSEGDLPDGTRYVRLFFGLKGTGTLWVDQVDFRYSKWNFTALERMTPYFDTVCHPGMMLVPVPKHITALKPVSLFRVFQGRHQAPLIVIPQNPAKAVKIGAALLQTRLNDLLQEQTWKGEISLIKIQQGGTVSQNYKGLIYSIGKTALFQQWKDSLSLDAIRDQPESYLIRSVGEEKKQVILYGNQARGNYYAVTTLVQLFDPEKNLFYNANIIDYPDFSGRSYLFSAWKNQEEMEKDVQDISRMSLMKLNKAYVGYGQTRGRKNWYNPDKLYIRGVQKAGDVCRTSGIMDLAIMVNPYYHFDYEMNIDSIPENLRYRFVHGDKKSIQSLENVYKIGLDAGARTLMFMADDFVPHQGENRKNYVLYTREDKDRFINLQNAQAHVINTLDKWLKQNYAGTRLEFCPPWYLNEFIDRSRGRAESYFKDMQVMVPEDLAMVWTGPTVRSLRYDLADFARYSNLIGRKPMIWDNTLYARALEGVYGGYPAYYPGKVRLCNLFEPYDVRFPENFMDLVDSSAMYVNGSASSEIYKIKYATVADFEWNTRAYNPEFSLWKVLVNNFGMEAGKHLIELSDAYYGLKEVIIRLKNRDTQKWWVSGEENVVRIRQLISQLQMELKEDDALIQELQSKMNEALHDFDNLKEQKK